MKFLIIGGTGTISYEFVKLLSKDKSNFISLINRGKRKRIIQKNIKIIKCNYKNINNKKKYLEHDYDVVINFIVYKKKDIINDYKLFKKRTKLYIFISSASVYQNVKKTIITEDSSANERRWWYQNEKIKCEQYLLQKSVNDKFPILIIRPGHIYDENVIPVSIWKHGLDLINYLLKKKEAFVFEQDNSWSIMHSKDFAENFINIIKNKDLCVGKIINICSIKIITWRKIYKIYAAILKIKIINFNIFKNNKLKKLPEDIYYQIVSDRSKFYIFSNKKIISLTGSFREKISLKKGLEECIKKNYYIIKNKKINLKLIKALKKAI
jgi:nucleoside-diphosphate-sugar epimerase